MQNETTEKLKILKKERLQLTRKYIVYKLRMRGYTISTFARKLGVTPQCVTNALRIRYPKMQREIARTIGEDPKRLWPERYDLPEKRNRRRASQKTKNSTVEENIKGKDLTEIPNLENGKEK